MNTAVTKTVKDSEFAIPATMKAWVLDGPDELRFTEKAVPEPGAAEVLLRVDACSLCGTARRDYCSGECRR